MARTPSSRRFTRRVFVHRLTFLGGGVVLIGGACKDGAPDRQSPQKKGRVPLTTSHQSFTNPEYEALSAACERILPADADVGAVAAGVPAYIDRMLTTPELEQMRNDFVAGLGALDRRAQRTYGMGFAGASAAQQDELLTVFKDSRKGTGEAHFYELLVVLTLEGFLGDPSYGGNRDRKGWELVGFTLVGKEAAQPPAGYDGMKHLHHPSSR